MTEPLKAPFPWFGGKRRVADLVWPRLGDVTNYIEPFAGSAAMLLCRPHAPKIETLNDLDCYVANFWRATQHDPEAVAGFADWPVNEADLHARHRWLVLSPAAAEFRERMRTDPDHFDAKVAGWWCWGLCCWIGSGWCVETESGSVHNKMPLVPRPTGTGSGGNSCGVHAEKGPVLAKRPKLTGGAPDSGALGTGVHSNGPDVQHQKPRLACGHDGHGGQGVHALGPSSDHRPQLADQYARGRGVHGYDQAETCRERREWLIGWFGRLRDRLRTARICCGDWPRVCESHSVTTRLGLTGIFFDPPYSTEAGRAADLYGQDSGTVAHDVRAYCLERGDDPQMRICLAGYEGEGHEALEARGWACVPWKTVGGYGNRGKGADGNANAARERLWFSAHCLDPERHEMPLFAAEFA